MEQLLIQKSVFELFVFFNCFYKYRDKQQRRSIAWKFYVIRKRMKIGSSVTANTLHGEHWFFASCTSIGDLGRKMSSFHQSIFSFDIDMDVSEMSKELEGELLNNLCFIYRYEPVPIAFISTITRYVWMWLKIVKFYCVCSKCWSKCCSKNASLLMTH